jgi:hypothetical protein
MVKKLIKKIKDKGDKDTANFSAKKLKKHQDDVQAKMTEEFLKKQAQEKKDISFIQKELKNKNGR